MLAVPHITAGLSSRAVTRVNTSFCAKAFDPANISCSLYHILPVFDHYQQVFLPRTSSQINLTPQNYYFDGRHLYLWVTNDQSKNFGVANQMGVMQQQVPDKFTPRALSSDLYRADLLPCNANPRDVKVADFSSGTTGSSDNIKLARNVWELLVLGKLYVTVAVADGSNGLGGQLMSLNPSDIRVPQGVSGFNMCNPDYDYTGLYNWTSAAQRVLQYDNFGLRVNQPCGSPVLELRLQNPWASVHYKALEFYTKLPVARELMLNVSANDGIFGGNRISTTSGHPTACLHSYQWTLVRIPLKALGVTTDLRTLRFGQNSNLYDVSILIDQVRLVSCSAISTTTVVSNSPQYTPSFCSPR
ncbi:hypothetical protein PROFUN_07534 [Planoprotostelium fungivorum]|uniref:Uncharacterized protein n=1 Tax=Planoprotostelium fungivorum TaxID=1890364 RepID=A0A2P6NLN9_9EUKA|nr:hypothetical protein PROFUN_07534 [Planoprotostelium fungivorum]